MRFSCCLLLLFAETIVAQYPLPIPFTGPAAANPPNTLDYQDITIIRRLSDGTYFRFSKGNDTGLGLSVATAPAYRGPWTYSYAALSGPLKDPVAANRSAVRLWAPEVHYLNNTYYLYYGINLPDHGDGQFDIAVATSPNLTENSWTDHGSVNIPAPVPSDHPDRPYVRLGVNVLANASDPSGFDVAYKHLAFGSFNWGLYGAYLDPQLLTANSSAGVVEMVADQYTPGDGTLQGNKTEGSYQLHYGNYIYMFYSIGNSCASPQAAGPLTVYRVQVCRGLYSDGPTGPFFDRDGVNCLTGSVNRTGTTLVASHGGNGSNYEVFSPGSICIVLDAVEGLVVHYQYKNLTDNEDQSLRFGFNPLSFDSEAWPVLLASQSQNATNSSTATVTSSTGSSAANPVATSAANSKKSSAINLLPEIWSIIMALACSPILIQRYCR